VIPKFDDGRLQTLAMFRNAELAGEQEPFLRVDHPLSRLSIPTGMDDPTCDADGLRSCVAYALRVGESLAGREDGCGGLIVRAW
jgi:hypothetical protein